MPVLEKYATSDKNFNKDINHLLPYNYAEGLPLGKWKNVGHVASLKIIKYAIQIMFALNLYYFSYLISHLIPSTFALYTYNF